MATRLRNRRSTGNSPVDSTAIGREAETACAALNVMEVPAVAKQATAEKRQRRERGSINPDDIISGAFELAEQVSIDNLSMPLLGKHLGVGVTSIYWYFRKKDDLLNAMTDRALSKYVFATPYVEASDWRETLRNHARSMRKTFMGNPISVRSDSDQVGAQPQGGPTRRPGDREGDRRSGRGGTIAGRGLRHLLRSVGSRPRVGGAAPAPGEEPGDGERRHAQSRTRWSSIPRPRRCWPR